MVRVRADLLGDNFDGFSADGSGHGVAEFLINNTLDGQFNIFADGFKSRGANFGNLFDILNGAVVFGLFISVSMAMTIGRGGVSVSGGGVAISRGGVVGGVGLVSSIRRSGVAGQSGHEWDKSQDSECLIRKKGEFKILLSPKTLYSLTVPSCCSACRVDRSSVMPFLLLLRYLYVQHSFGGNTLRNSCVAPLCVRRRCLLGQRLGRPQ